MHSGQQGEYRHMIPRHGIPRKVIDGHRFRNVPVIPLGRSIETRQSRRIARAVLTIIIQLFHLQTCTQVNLAFCSSFLAT